MSPEKSSGRSMLKANLPEGHQSTSGPDAKISGPCSRFRDSYPELDTFQKVWDAYNSQEAGLYDMLAHEYGPPTVGEAHQAIDEQKRFLPFDSIERIELERGSCWVRCTDTHSYKTWLLESATAAESSNGPDHSHGAGDGPTQSLPSGSDADLSPPRPPPESSANNRNATPLETTQPANGEPSGGGDESNREVEIPPLYITLEDDTKERARLFREGEYLDWTFAKDGKVVWYTRHPRWADWEDNISRLFQRYQSK